MLRWAMSGRLLSRTVVPLRPVFAKGLAKFFRKNGRQHMRPAQSPQALGTLAAVQVGGVPPSMHHLPPGGHSHPLSNPFVGFLFDLHDDPFSSRHETTNSVLYVPDRSPQGRLERCLRPFLTPIASPGPRPPCLGTPQRPPPPIRQTVFPPVQAALTKLRSPLRLPPSFANHKGMLGSVTPRGMPLVRDYSRPGNGRSSTRRSAQASVTVRSRDLSRRSWRSPRRRSG